MRIHKVIAKAGIASRRKAEELIENGAVVLNGEVIKRQGVTMIPGIDSLEVLGEPVVIPQTSDYVVYAFYKPKNCITSLNDPQGRDTVKNYFPKTKKRLFPVGRLDYDAEGLLFLTNDGDFAQKITHPKYKMWKKYFVKIKGNIPKDDIKKLEKGPIICGKTHSPTRIKPLNQVNNKTWLDVCLREGTNQHIKKMFLNQGYHVLKIKRHQIGCVSLGELSPGESRKLTSHEIELLLKGTGVSP